MNFQEAERAYHDLRAQYAAQKLTSKEFEDQVAKLKLQDAEGRWWQIGVQSGEWYVHDGQKWTKSKPPMPVAATVAPSASPEDSAAPPVAAAAAPPPNQPTGRSRVMPRFFSAAPAGRNGGLPTPVLIGIIAVVALLGIGIIIAAFMFVSGNLAGNTTTKTQTPVRTAVAQSSPSVPTLPPPPATSVPIVVPTVPGLVPTATVAITPTTAVTVTTAPTKPAGPTATKKPTSPTATATATATKAPQVAPGIYVTKLVLDPPAPNFGDAIGFKVTLLNSTGQGQTYRWLVKVFQCSQNPCVAEDFRKSFGESTSQDSTIPTGTTELTAPKHLSIGLGACTYVAMPHYYDPITQQPTPFLQTNGQPMYYVFSLCH